MSSSRLRFARSALPLLALPAMVVQFSCTTEKVINNVIATDTIQRVDTLTDTLHVRDTVVHKDTVTDTLHVRDTVVHKDTVTDVRWDTLRDTMRYSVGKPAVTCVGLVVGGIEVPMSSSSVRYPDTCYAYLSVNANPTPLGLSPAVNDSVLAASTGSNLKPFVGGFVPGMVPADVGKAEYDRYFIDTSSTFVFNVPVPYYASDTGSTLSYDTIVDTTRLPSIADSLAAANQDGTPYDSVDLFASYGTDSLHLRRIPLDRDLHVSWQGNADWYGIECRKYNYYGGWYTVGTFLDTFTTTRQVAIPHGYFYQDTVYNSSSYVFLYVSVVAVNGPSPGTWKLQSSFHGKGCLLSMRGNVTPYLTLYADPTVKPQGGLGKRAALGLPALSTPTAVEIISRILAK